MVMQIMNPGGEREGHVAKYIPKYEGRNILMYYLLFCSLIPSSISSSSLTSSDGRSRGTGRGRGEGDGGICVELLPLLCWCQRTGTVIMFKTTLTELEIQNPCTTTLATTTATTTIPHTFHRLIVAMFPCQLYESGGNSKVSHGCWHRWAPICQNTI